MKKPRSIDEYLAAVPADRRAALETLRAMIRKAAPQAEECISYSMPAFRLPEERAPRVGNRVVAGFLATNKGCSYYPHSGSTLHTLADEVKAYGGTKSALHFDPARGLPVGLVRKLVKTRLAEIAAEAKPAAKTGTTTRSPRKKP